MQNIGNNHITIHRDRDKNTNSRFVGITPIGSKITTIIPLNKICGLAAGKDAWMRKIEVKCDDCGGIFQAGHMDGLNCCPDCIAMD